MNNVIPMKPKSNTIKAKRIPKDVVNAPQFCDKCLWRFIRDCKFKKTDPWMAKVVAGQVTMFQAVTTDEDVRNKIGEDIKNISTLGCLGCLKPEMFDVLLQVAASKDIKEIKALGNAWVQKAMEKENVSKDRKKDS